MKKLLKKILGTRRLTKEEEKVFLMYLQRRFGLLGGLALYDAGHPFFVKNNQTIFSKSLKLEFLWGLIF